MLNIGESSHITFVDAALVRARTGSENCMSWPNMAALPEIGHELFWRAESL